MHGNGRDEHNCIRRRIAALIGGREYDWGLRASCWIKQRRQKAIRGGGKASLVMRLGLGRLSCSILPRSSPMCSGSGSLKSTRARFAMVHSLCSSVCADLTVQCMSVRAPQVLLARPVRPAELVKCVREILRRELGKICVAADIARRLEMDRRSLQRHLRSEGTTFREISREIQLQASQRLLASGASVSDVAKALGFSELSAFTHAFRRWSGETPSSWSLRHQVIKGEQSRKSRAPRRSTP